MDNRLSESIYKRLQNLLSQINLIYIDSQKKISLEKKMEIYNKGSALIVEAESLIETIQANLADLGKNGNTNDFSKINEYADLLSIPNQNFDQVLYIVEKLCELNRALPTTAKIFDNVENELVKAVGGC